MGEDGEEKEKSGRRYFGTKVVLIVSGEHRCKTRRRFECAEKREDCQTATT